MRNMRIIVWLSVGIAALLGVNILLTFNDSQDTAIVQRTSLLPFPDDAVSLIEISRGGVVESVLTHTGSWRLVEPFAGSVDEAVVLKLLDALAYAPLDDSLGDQELLRLGRTRADFGLESPRLAVRIRAGASETAISFGSPTPSASGVYAAIDDVRAVFVVPSNTFAAVDVPASGFRRRTLFTSGEESVASFDVKRGAGEFMRFRREGDGWLMVQPTEGPASLTKIKKLLSDVMSASAVDFVWPVGGSNEVAEASDALLAGYGLGAESAVTLTLKGTDGSDRRISFGSDAGEGRVYALVHNGAAVVTVDAALKDLVSPGNSALADTRLFPYETSQVSGMSIVDDGVACMLAKNEDGTWRLDSPISAAASSTAVDSLLSAVLALRGGDTDENGVEVSISADERKVRVSRAALGPGFRLENLRKPAPETHPSGERRCRLRKSFFDLVANSPLALYSGERKIYLLHTRKDRREDGIRSLCFKYEKGFRRRFFETFEQRVRRLLVHPVGFRHDDEPPAAAVGRRRELFNYPFANLIYGDFPALPCGNHESGVGMPEIRGELLRRGKERLRHEKRKPARFSGRAAKEIRPRKSRKFHRPRKKRTCVGKNHQSSLFLAAMADRNANARGISAASAAKTATVSPVGMRLSDARSPTGLTASNGITAAATARETAEDMRSMRGADTSPSYSSTAAGAATETKSAARTANTATLLPNDAPRNTANETERKRSEESSTHANARFAAKMSPGIE